MEGRDGAASSPSVTVYRAKEPARHGSILDPSRRVKFEQKPHRGQQLREDQFLADPELMMGKQKKQELIVIVKRGSGVDYEEKKDSPFLECDLRRDLPGMTWNQIRALCIDNQFDYEDDTEGWPLSEEEDEDEEDDKNDEEEGWFTNKKDDAAETDDYRDVDEYIWSLLHFGFYLPLIPWSRGE